MEENHLGLIELHFKFGDKVFAERGAFVLVPSKSKTTHSRTLISAFKLKICTTVIKSKMNFDLIRPNTSSDAAWGLALDWLVDCKENHPKCREAEPRNGWNPSRLLDVGTLEDPTLRLYDTSSTSEDLMYTTLSHCWGKIPIHRLLSSNLEDMKAVIDPTILTKSFRDAVEITRRMQVSYLWIDSLCIMQDSVTDWNYESLLMGLVYRYGVCNIAATSGRDGRAGCFFDRNPLLVQPLVVQATWSGRSLLGSLKESNLSTNKLLPGEYCVYRGEWKEEIENAPLNQRAWVVQERLLAPRIMHFSSQQIYWECRTCRASETLPKGLPERPTFKIGAPSIEDEGNDWQKTIKKTKELCVRLKSPPTPRKYMEVRQWDEIVSAYTKCGLTKEKDKLIAISGIADCFEEKMKDDYLAGLWRSVLPYQLLWRVEDPASTRRPEEYRAPSWSWAAIEGEVKETFHIQQEDKVGKDTCVTILEARVTIPSSEVTDNVTGGHIKMSGRLARGTLMQQDQSNAAMSTRAQGGEATAIYGVPELHLHLKDNKSGLLDKTPTYDIISESFQHKEVYCLLIRHTKYSYMSSGITEDLLPEQKFPMSLRQKREPKTESKNPPKSSRVMGEFGRLLYAAPPENIYPQLKGLILVPTGNAPREFRRIGTWGVLESGVAEKKVFEAGCNAFNDLEKDKGWEVENVKGSSYFTLTLV